MRAGVRAVGATGGTARDPRTRGFDVHARADAARTSPHRVRALAARSSAALAGVVAQTQIRPLCENRCRGR
jgi:hypothetical protein